MTKLQLEPVQIMNLDIEEILHFFLSITSTKAVGYLGAQISKENGAVKDLNKARLCIDTSKMLVNQLKPYLNENEKEQLDKMISNLQMAFIREI